MSILIKEMEMPKSGRYFVAVDNADGKDKTVIAIMSEFERGDKTRPLLAVHEIVPVPPHGRLIDADALAVNKFVGAEHDISVADGGACYRRGWNDAIEAIMENAETIIGGE